MDATLPGKGVPTYCSGSFPEFLRSPGEFRDPGGIPPGGIHPDYVEILERNMNNRQERLFLEALHSVQDCNSLNEHVQFLQVYLPLVASLETSDA